MEDQNDITDFFVSLITSHGSIDVAEAEFKRLVAEDNELRAQYRAWCEESGTTERHGFGDFAQEYLEGRESKWDILDEYSDDQY